MQNNIDLNKVVLLDNESTMNLLCNPDLVEYIQNVKETFTIQINIG